MWDYEKIGNEMAMKMMLIDGIREPTLTQIQEDSDRNVCVDRSLLSVPAWSYFSEPHPGLPEHYHTVNFYDNLHKLTVEDDDDLQLPKVPFSMVDHEIKYKLLINLKPARLGIPALKTLKNGTIIITSSSFPSDIGNETEIYLNFHDKLLPCCFTTSTSDVIMDSPLTTECRVRCYYLVIPSVVTEITFMKSNGRVIYRCEYEEMWLHGSASYHQLCEAAEDLK